MNKCVIYFYKRKNMGLTLLEVLIAVTIFSIVVTAIYSTFRIGMKAYSIGNKNMEELQQIRFIFDTFSKDIRTIYYLDESAYNIQAQKRIEDFEKEHNKAIQEGREDEFLALYDPSLASLLGKEETETKDNPYNQGISIDLQMSGEDGDDFDKICFARYEISDGEMKTEPWALARIEWSVEDGRLIRKQSTIFMPERDLEGEEVEEPKERIDILCNNVVKFNLVYGYYCADQWFEAQKWDTTEKQFRNPVPELDPEDPEYDHVKKTEETLPRDGLPAYVRLEITLSDLKQKENTENVNEGNLRFFSITVNFPSSQENFIPIFEEDSELYELTYETEKSPNDNKE